MKTEEGEEKMPRLKPDETEERRKVVRACVSSGRELYSVSEDSLAARMGVTKEFILM